MIFPARMRHLTAIVLSNHSDAITRKLLQLGVLHTVDVEDLVNVPQNQLSHYRVEERERGVSETRSRIEGFLSLASLKPDTTTALNIDTLETVDIEAVNADLDSLSTDLQQIRNRQKELQSEINKLRDIERHMETFGDLERGLAVSGEHSYLSVAAGTAPTGATEEIRADLGSVPSVVLPLNEEGDREALVVVTLRRNDSEVRQILERHEFSEQSLAGSSPELGKAAYQDVESKIAALKTEQKSESAKLTRIIQDRSEELRRLWANLRMSELYMQLRSHFSHTDHAVLVSGWVPSDSTATVESEIQSITDGHYYIEWSSVEKVQKKTEGRMKAPVQLRNPRLLKPFQMLVVNYAVPDYGTIDPTPFVAVSYLVMFGLMFQDAGHGLVLILLGLLGLWLTRNGGANDGMRSLLRLGVWCGGASIVTGVLFGSYFGMPWLPPLWFDYHGVVAGHGGNGVFDSIFDILALTIYLGIAIIGLGLLLNWINLISKRKWIDLVFDKGGILVGMIYGGGTAIAFEFAAGGYRSLSSPQALLALVAIPSLLLFLKAPIEHAAERRAGHGEPLNVGSLLWFLMEWVIELLEVFSGYLANTLSFMRVAGLGIAHVTLMMAFFQIAEMAAGGSGMSFLSVLILILGNALVIALEGLSAGIQSLRLNYYEFFSKYFSGTGEAYRPVSLKPST